MMAYAQLYRVERLMLLYPYHPALPSAGPLGQHRIAVNGGAGLHVATVDVTTGRADCAQALATLLGPVCPLVAAQAA